MTSTSPSPVRAICMPAWTRLWISHHNVRVAVVESPQSQFFYLQTIVSVATDSIVPLSNFLDSRRNERLTGLTLLFWHATVPTIEETAEGSGTVGRYLWKFVLVDSETQYIKYYPRFESIEIVLSDTPLALKPTAKAPITKWFRDIRPGVTACHLDAVEFHALMALDMCSLCSLMRKPVTFHTIASHAHKYHPSDRSSSWVSASTVSAEWAEFTLWLEPLDVAKYTCWVLCSTCNGCLHMLDASAMHFILLSATSDKMMYIGMEFTLVCQSDRYH
ncbi:hypothetical protein B0H21DRAFT_747856 [Amylocystis lapponica]|nr:hypothetical protein B0H21DRAFT_747856 [Amylocystis lapponica]